jgi:DNA-binding transcriptional regulator YhcF (GntR family)
MAQPTIDIKTKEQGRIWLLLPYNYSLRRIANELSIGAATVSKWRKELVSEDLLKEDVEQKTENFTAEQIFSFVIETSTMTEHELAEYCRSKGLFVEKVKEWRTISIQAHQSKAENQYKQDSFRRSDKKKIKALEKELARKNQALAETAALLVLREKFNALWETSEED